MIVCIFVLQLGILFGFDFKWTRCRVCQCPRNPVTHDLVPPLAVGQLLVPPKSMGDTGEDMDIGRNAVEVFSC